jgi:hypothetical protein
VNSVGVCLCRTVWMEPFLLSLSSLCFCVVVLRNLLLAGVRK